MRIYIKVTDSLRRKLASRFNVSKPTVWSALNYLTKSDLAEAIRQYALNHGGAIEEQCFIPNCRTECIFLILVDSIIEIITEKG